MPSSPLASPLPWDLVSEAYAQTILPVFNGYAADALQLAALPARSHLADVGCGPGTLTLRARALGHTVAALDFSPLMVGQLRGALGADPGTEITEGDGQALPWADGSFDAAFSMFALIFFPDRAAGLRELRRVVRPGGPIIVSSWQPLERVPEFNVLFSALAELLPQSTPPAPVLADEAAFHGEFAAVGLTNVSVHSSTHTLTAPDAAAWFNSMCRVLAPLALMEHHMGPAWPAFRDTLGERVIARLGPGPVACHMPAWLGLARS